MSRIPVRPGLLAASVVVPLLAGCSALGLPDDPASVGLSATGPDSLAPASTAEPASSPSLITSSDGYSLTLPPGWVASRTNSEATRAVLDAIIAGDGLLGAEASALYDDTDADLSLVATDASELGLAPVPPVLAILVVPSQRGAQDAERRVDGMIAGLTTVTGEIQRSVTSVRAGDAQRYDLVVAGDVLTVQLRLYLFTIGDDAIVILFGSDPSLAGGASPAMEAIVKSLRFGV